MDPEHLIGRYAKVVNCSDPAWCNQHVQVRAFRSSDGTYEVATEGGGTNLSSSQLELYSPPNFVSKYPNAEVVQGSHAMTELPVGCVVDFSKANPNVMKTSPHLEINGPCRVFGKPSSQPGGKVNTINNHILVKANENDLVEFENVYFEGDAAGTRWVECTGGHIVFRSCFFTKSRNAVIIGLDTRPNLQVEFESCTFSHIFETAVTVESGRVKCVNCVFGGVGIGICMRQGEYLDCDNNTFISCTGAVILLNQGTARVKNCQFELVTDFCLLVSNGPNVRAESCVATSCGGSAVVVEGGSTTSATIHGWVFKECDVGVRVGNGTVSVKLDHMAFKGCKLGVYVAVDAVGFVDMVTCGKINCIDVSGDKCFVYMCSDSRPITQQERLNESVSAHSTLNLKYGYPVSTAGKRVLSEFGIMSVQCAKCKALSPHGDLFKKCAMCKEARYCSKECQETHWSAHAAECRVLQLRSTALLSQGYLACDKCGKVEVLSSAQLHNACSRCVSVLYCSRECQKAAWPAHKQRCLPFEKPK